MTDETPASDQAEPAVTTTVVAAAEDAHLCAVVEDGAVVNVVLANAELAQENAWPVIEGLDPQPQIGWTTDGHDWQAPLEPTE